MSSTGALPTAGVLFESTLTADLLVPPSDDVQIVAHRYFNLIAQSPFFSPFFIFKNFVSCKMSACPSMP